MTKKNSVPLLERRSMRNKQYLEDLSKVGKYRKLMSIAQKLEDRARARYLHHAERRQKFMTFILSLNKGKGDIEVINGWAIRIKSSSGPDVKYATIEGSLVAKVYNRSHLVLVGIREDLYGSRHTNVTHSSAGPIREDDIEELAKRWVSMQSLPKDLAIRYAGSRGTLGLWAKETLES